MITQLGQTIRNLRKQKNITLNDFADKLDISAGYLSNLETGKTMWEQGHTDEGRSQVMDGELSQKNWQQPTTSSGIGNTTRTSPVRRFTQQAQNQSRQWKSDDEEVNYWKKKIAELSKPIPGTSGSPFKSSRDRSLLNF